MRTFCMYVLFACTYLLNVIDIKACTLTTEKIIKLFIYFVAIPIFYRI